MQLICIRSFNYTIFYEIVKRRSPVRLSPLTRRIYTQPLKMRYMTVS